MGIVGKLTRLSRGLIIIDLFKLVQSPKTKNPLPAEADSLRQVMQALRSNQYVAWVERQNSSATQVGGRFIKFGWRGCSDILVS